MEIILPEYLAFYVLENNRFIINLFIQSFIKFNDFILKQQSISSCIDLLIKNAIKSDKSYLYSLSYYY